MLGASSSELRVQYTVWSGNRLIGTTDLGFRYREGDSRTGWFFPSATGDGLMDEIVDPLIGHYFNRSSRTASGPLSRDDFTRLAQYEKACERAAAWDLRLRREDGSPIPTESVGIRDVEALLACYPNDESFEEELDAGFEFDNDPSEAWKRSADDEAAAALRRDIEHDLQLIDEWMEDEPESDEFTQVAGEALPRYQIFVLLSDPSAVP